MSGSKIWEERVGELSEQMRRNMRVVESGRCDGCGETEGEMGLVVRMWNEGGDEADFCEGCLRLGLERLVREKLSRSER